MTVSNEAAERLREFLVEISNDQPSDALRDLADALAHERSAGAAPPEPITDISVLAEAILRHDANDSWPLGSQIAHDRGKCGNERCATAIAAEYARLLDAAPSPSAVLD